MHLEAIVGSLNSQRAVESGWIGHAVMPEVRRLRCWTGLVDGFVHRPEPLQCRCLLRFRQRTPLLEGFVGKDPLRHHEWRRAMHLQINADAMAIGKCHGHGVAMTVA